MENNGAVLPLATSGATPSPILLDSLFLVGLRFIYFLLSRRFLLATLNPTLRDLSGPETILPSISQPLLNGRACNSNASIAPLSVSDVELDTEDDPLTSHASPASSYPPSPARKSTLPLTPNSGYLGDNLSISLPTLPDADRIEMDTLGQKLKAVGVRSKVQVLKLAHGKNTSVASNGVKKATRGLNRVARYVQRIPR
jgi:hypothetical protein